MSIDESAFSKTAALGLTAMSGTDETSTVGGSEGGAGAVVGRTVVG